MKTKEWPQAGDKVIFKGCPAIYYPMFTNMQTFCKENLVVGQEYELAEVNIHSSWVSVRLKGLEDTFLNWIFFKYVK
jgi:hypothetical protein